jgi:hypothetical protein
MGLTLWCLVVVCSAGGDPLASKIRLPALSWSIRGNGQNAASVGGEQCPGHWRWYVSLFKFCFVPDFYY